MTDGESITIGDLTALTLSHIRELAVLAEAVEADWVRIAEETGKDWSQRAYRELHTLPASLALDRYLQSLDEAQVKELIAVYMNFCEVDAADCFERAEAGSVDYFLCEPLPELFQVLARLLSISGIDP
jgi:hypothetical protein